LACEVNSLSPKVSRRARGDAERGPHRAPIAASRRLRVSRRRRRWPGA